MFLQVCVCPRGGLPQCMLRYTPPVKETPPPGRRSWQGDPTSPCQGDPPAKETPCQGDTPNPPSKETHPCQGDPPFPLSRRPPCQGDPLPRRHPPPPFQGDSPLPRRPPSRPTTRGEIEGDQVQAHTQGGNWRGSDPGPHPRGKFRGITSRPTPKGEIQGDHIQAHTQGGNSGGSHPGPHPRGKFRGIRTRHPPPSPCDDYCCGRYTSYWCILVLPFKIELSAFLHSVCCPCMTSKYIKTGSKNITRWLRNKRMFLCPIASKCKKCIHILLQQLEFECPHHPWVSPPLNPHL